MKKITLTLRNYSLLASISLIAMTFLAIYAYGLVINPLYIEGDAIETARNIQNSGATYYSGVVGWVLILIADLLVSLAFYKILKPVALKFAILSGGSRLIYTLLLSFAIYHLFTLELSTFMYIWSLGLFVFGFHLILTGVATIKSRDIPLYIGVFLIIAGIGYAVTNGIYQFLPVYEDIGHTLESVMSLPMMIGELAFAIWLLVKGGK